MAWLLRAACALSIGWLSTTTAWGQFTPPVQVSSSTGTCSAPKAVVDIADNVLFSYLCGSDVYFSSTVLMPGIDVAVTSNPNETYFVDLVRTAGGVRVVFDQEALPGDATGDILTSSNSSGSFGSAINLTLTSDDDRTPRVSRGVFDDFSVTWSATPAGSPSQVYLRRNLPGANQLVGEGTNAHVADDFFGVTTVTYERGGETYYRNFEAGVLAPEALLGLPSGASVVALAGAEALHVLYLDGGSLYYANDEGGSLGAGELLSAGSFTGGFDLSARTGGTVAAVASVGGEVHLWQRAGGVFGATQVATLGAIEAIAPSVAQDSYGHAHIVYEEAGTIFYVNNVPVPTADFTATGTTGELLLEVAFQNTSSGVISSYLWDFGDGTTSTAANPTHIYDEVGTYTVSLTVEGPGGGATETKIGFVEALAPTNLITIPMLPVFAMQAVSHPVIATNTVAIQGFQVAIVYNSNRAPITNVSFAGTTTGSLNPEFVIVDLDPVGPGSELIVSVVLDIQEPFDGRTIDPGPNNLLCLLEYTVPFTTLGETVSLTLVNGIGDDDQSNNLFTTEGVSLLPYLVSGGYSLSVLPQTTFVRGDATLNGGIDVADAIFVLAYLFSGGANPMCPDSADANDTGAIDVGDAIFMLDFLFGGGSLPPYPFPVPGLDPTPDSLGPCI